MGFIERLRQEKEAREAREAAEKEKLRREPIRTVSQESWDELKGRSLLYYQISECESIVQELCHIIGARFFDNRGVDLDGDRTSVEHFYEETKRFGVTVGIDSIGVFVDLGRLYEGRNMIDRGFAIEIVPDGTIKFHARRLWSSAISRTRWRGNPGVIEFALERVYNYPLEKKERYDPTSHYVGNYHEGPCLPGYVFISTPLGLIPIKNLKVGDFVWTVDELGNKIATVITKTSKVPVKRNHKMLHIVLSDGRELFVSSGHPGTNGLPLGDYAKGESLDGALVISANIIPYKEKYTYDILPAGPTGNYWANGILIGSTLAVKDQYQNYFITI